MKTRQKPFWAVVAAILLLPYVAAHAGKGTTVPTPSSPAPEMERLAKALVGDWNTTETMEKSEFFPNGASREGVVHVRLAAAGAALIYEVDSSGSAGKLNRFLAIWWDKPAQLFRFFICFNSVINPCRMRGTAHWDGDEFVNDYEETVNGKKTQCRDSFTFTPTSHTLVAAMDTGNSRMKTIITTRATRR